MTSVSNPLSQPARTPDQQVNALLEFKAALTDDEGVLQNWRNGSDPCLDGWDGVGCNCTERGPDGLPRSPFCVDRDANGTDPMVLELTLGASNREAMLNGMISPALGNLTELWKLDLSGQALTGTIPDALVNLKNLAFLSLRSNQLTGTLPAFLSEFELLTEVLLGQNEFVGAVPASWCDQAGNRSETPGFRDRISLEGNLGLCGKLPDCFNETSLRFADTNLQLRDGMGGVCDQTPPVCDEAEIIVPKFWTNASQITFNFTGCKDDESGISEETFSVQRSGSPEDEKGGLVKNESLPEPVVEEMKEGRKVRMFVFNLTEVELKDGSHFIVIVTSANKAQTIGEDRTDLVDLNVTMAFDREDLMIFASLFEQNVTVPAIPEGDSYVVEVLARNEAGLEDQATATIAVVPNVIGGTERSRRTMGNLQQSALQCRVEMLKDLMDGLLDVSSETGRNRRIIREPIEQSQFEIRDVAFVVTDLEAPSAMALHPRTVFNKMLDEQNSIIRELPEQENGYETGTEADSQIAVAGIVDAVVFSMNVRHRFLQHKWTIEMFKLPCCNTEMSAVGKLVFKPPCARMGLDWASDGTDMTRIHPVTKQHVFAGLALEVAKMLGNAASDGQVLMTNDTWKELQPLMKYAESPTVERVGLFYLPKWPIPVWL
ncbi:unnamed protein product [Ostreobium quekettii]|uniref:Leucine-rich repeat-containing N-terminal plant-type domain-containing protein n=1 Tax=Ostreobium quekettii TaxID=121088 RepID=A0A8S1ILJ6_9CHLO|nr:unnamed protein product [Ostreobium quekettii]